MLLTLLSKRRLTYADGKPRPRCRGVLHLIFTLVALFGVFVLLLCTMNDFMMMGQGGRRSDSVTLSTEISSTEISSTEISSTEISAENCGADEAEKARLLARIAELEAIKKKLQLKYRAQNNQGGAAAPSSTPSRLAENHRLTNNWHLKLALFLILKSMTTGASAYFHLYPFRSVNSVTRALVCDMIDVLSFFFYFVLPFQIIYYMFFFCFAKVEKSHFWAKKPLSPQSPSPP